MWKPSEAFVIPAWKGKDEAGMNLERVGLVSEAMLLY